MNPVRITLLGRPISKKNSKNIGVNKYTKRIFFTSSNAWKKFETYALEQLLEYKRCRFYGSVFISYEFYYKGKLSVDVENAIAGINDVLELSGIIENDKFVEEGSFKLHRGCPDWKSEITIRKL